MHTDDTAHLGQVDADVAQCVDHLVAVAARKSKANGSHCSSNACSERSLQFECSAEEMRLIATDTLGPFSWLIEPRQVRRGSKRFVVGGLVHREADLFVQVPIDVAPRHIEAGNTGSLRHMLVGMPIVEVAFMARLDAMPNAEECLTVKTHDGSAS